MRKLAVRPPLAGARSRLGAVAGRPPTLALGIASIGATVLLSLVTTSSGCNKKNESPRAAPIAANAGAQGAAPAAAPAPGAPAAPPSAAPAGGGGTIVGQIQLAPSRKGDVTPSDVVYLVARRVADNPSARGSLVAVKRYTASSFPIEFTLGAGDMMFKNGAFEGELTLAARVD
ncbi:MAG: hypothetical protein ABUL67_00075, partial [Haliangium ochraceum]